MLESKMVELNGKEVKAWIRKDGKTFLAIPTAFYGQFVVSLRDENGEEEERFLHPFPTEDMANEVAKMLAETFNDGWYEADVKNGKYAGM